MKTKIKSYADLSVEELKLAITRAEQTRNNYGRNASYENDCEELAFLVNDEIETMKAILGKKELA